MNDDYSIEQSKFFDEVMNFESFENIIIYKTDNACVIKTMKSESDLYIDFKWDLILDIYFIRNNSNQNVKFATRISFIQKNKIKNIINQFKQEIKNNDSLYSLNSIDNEDHTTLELRYNDILINRTHYRNQKLNFEMIKHFLLHFINNPLRLNSIFFENKIKDHNLVELKRFIQKELSQSLSEFD